MLSILFFLPIFFEIITGVIADTFGRKFSVLIGVFGEILILVAIISTTNYILLFLFFIIWGIIITFTTGADDAWAIELIPEELKEKYLDRFYPLASSFFNFGMIIAGILSSLLLFFYDNRSIWIARLFIVIIMGVVLFFTKENFYKEKIEHSNITQFKATFSKGLKFFISNSNTKNIILGEFFATITLVGIGSVVIQQYLLDSNLKESYWGIIYSFSAFAGIFIPLLAMRVVNNFLSEKVYLITVYILQIILYLVVSFLVGPMVAILFIFFHNSFEDAFNPINSAFFQKEIPPKIRATLSSLQTTFMGLAAFLGTIFAGFLIKNNNSRVSIGMLAIFLIVAILFYIKIKTPVLKIN